MKPQTKSAQTTELSLMIIFFPGRVWPEQCYGTFLKTCLWSYQKMVHKIKLVKIVNCHWIITSLIAMMRKESPFGILAGQKWYALCKLKWFWDPFELVSSFRCESKHTTEKCNSFKLSRFTISSATLKRFFFVCVFFLVGLLLAKCS